MPIRRKPRSRRKPLVQELKLGCPFCWEWVPPPGLGLPAFSPEGCEGGQCTCGAWFVVDRTGKSGGQALLDARALASEGDLERALALREGEDFEVKSRTIEPETRSNMSPVTGHSYLGPRVWFIRLKYSS